MHTVTILPKMKSHFCYIAALFTSLTCSLVFAVQRPRGVSIEKASFYQEGNNFVCLSDGKTISFDHVNDDYCDCDDGSDEPGTAACSNGVFYCENKGHKGAYIMSSRVNDGICDCCDGSDEYDGIISCPNTCLESYEKEMAQQEIFRKNQEQGYAVKMEYMQQGKRAKDEKLAKLSELEQAKSALTVEKENAEAAKKAAEEPEKIAIDEHKKAFELIKEEKKKAKETQNAATAFAALDHNGDGKVDFPEVMKHTEFDINSDGTVSEEEAKEYLEDSEEADLTTFTEKIYPNIKEIFKVEEMAKEGETTPDATAGDGGDGSQAEAEKDLAGSKRETIPVDIAEGGAPEDAAPAEDVIDTHNEGDERHGDDEGDDEDDLEDDESDYDIGEDKTAPTDSDEEKEPEYNEETKRLIAEADEARKRFDEADSKLRDHDKEINDIKSYLETDFGPDQEFAALKGQCFEYTDREYTYRLCPFDKTTQKNKNGGIETSLGNWGKWHGPDDDKYDAMKYENGQGCWNGPNRSTHVNLHCGATNEVTSASEPSRCEYQFEFTTPAKCQKPAPVGTRDVHEEL